MAIFVSVSTTSPARTFIVPEAGPAPAEVRSRFGDAVDRFSFYAPYKVDAEAWKEVPTGFKD